MAYVSLQNGEEPQVITRETAPPRLRSGTIRRDNTDINERNRMPDKRYNPFTRGDSYKPVPRVRRVARKRNPLMPTVSYVPSSVILNDQPLVNVEDPTMRDPISAREELATNRLPETTVMHAIPESRNYRNQLRSINSILDTRAQNVRMIGRYMDAMTPDRDEIVDIKQHRQHQLSQNPPEQGALADVLRQKMQGRAMAGQI